MLLLASLDVIPPPKMRVSMYPMLDNCHAALSSLAVILSLAT